MINFTYMEILLGLILVVLIYIAFKMRSLDWVGWHIYSFLQDYAKAHNGWTGESIKTLKDIKDILSKK